MIRLWQVGSLRGARAHRDMGLYTNRLAELSDPVRRHRRASRRVSFERPYPRPSAAPPPRRPFTPVSPIGEAPRRKPMAVQSLLFGRDAGWSVGKAQAWAKSHGYRSGKPDVTDQYIRLRQFDPKGLKVKRTITLGRGIRAVVAREESMAITTQESRRRRRRRSRTAAAAPAARPRRRRAREASVAEAKKPHRRRAKSAAKTPRTKRHAAKTTRRAAKRRRPSQVMAPRRHKARKAAPRRHRRRVEAWHGNPAGHRKAAKKGWRKRKSRRSSMHETTQVASPRRRASRRRHSTMEAPRHRRRSSSSSRRRTHEMQAPRRRRHYARAASTGRGMEVADLAIAIVAGGLGFVAADALDRFLATYDPAAATKPTDKFTSDGAGTLANTLNVAAMPDWKRVAAVVGAAVVPAVGSVYVENPMLKSALEGFTVGVGVKAFQLLWSNVLMPLLKPKDTSAGSLQKSIIARLYPAEVAAAINLEAKPAQMASSGGAFTGLSQPPPGYQYAPPTTGVGAPDVGPFALAGESPYPDAAQALRREAGVQGPGSSAGPLPTVQQITGGPDNRAAGLSQPPGYSPGPGATPGPGPQPEGTGCSSYLADDNNQFLGFIGDAEDDRPMPILNGAAA